MPEDAVRRPFARRSPGSSSGSIGGGLAHPVTPTTLASPPSDLGARPRHGRLASRRHARAVGGRHVGVPPRPADPAADARRVIAHTTDGIPYATTRDRAPLQGEGVAAEGRRRLRRCPAATGPGTARVAGRSRSRSSTQGITGFARSLPDRATRAGSTGRATRHALLAERAARVADAAPVPDQEMREPAPSRPAARSSAGRARSSRDAPDA